MKRSILFILITLFTCSIGIFAQDEYRIEVVPAANGSIQLYHENGIEITEAEMEEGFASVIKGEVVTVIASPVADHELSSISVQGGNNIQYDSTNKNIAKFTVTGTTSKVVVTPVFTGNGIKVSFTTAGTQNGTFIVRYNGKAISSGATVPYGAEIEIVGQPTNESYAVSEVKVNDQTIGTATNNIVTHIISEEITSISISFISREVRIIHLKPSSDSETPVIKKGSKNNFDTAEDITLGSYIPYNTQITIQPKAYSYEYMYTLIINGNHCTLDADGFYSLTAKEDLKVSLRKIYKTRLGVAALTLSNQTQTYTGSAVHYSQFATIPTGLSDIILKYNTGTGEYTTTPPINAGEYNVEITRLTDKYVGFSIKKAKLIIETAPIKIKSLPIVVSNNEGTYSTSGGTAYFNNTLVACDLAVLEISSNKTLAKVEFTPKSSNYKKAYCWAPIGNQLSNYTLKFSTTNGAIPLLLNGEKEITNGEKVAKGTTLQLTVPIVPTGYKVKKIINKISNTQNEDIFLENGIKDILVQKDYNLFVELEIETTEKLPQWTLTLKDATPYPYTGTAKVHPGTSLPTFFFPSTSRPGYATAQNIRYKDNNGNFVIPINAGKYELSVFFPAQSGKDSITVRTSFTINKETPLLLENPKAVGTQVPYGLRLNQVPIYGGQPNIPGTFQWLNGGQLVKNGQTYTIQFVPNDSQNYNTISAQTETLYINSDQLILFGSSNGTITVKNKNTGASISSGDLIKQGDQLIISASPYNGYYLQKLSICKNYGMESNISSGAVYTVDDDSPLVINAEFRSNSSSTTSNPLANATVQSNTTYQVYVPTVAGVVASPTGYNSVKEGETFTLKVDYDSDYSAPTVKANNQTLVPKAGNEYVYSNINSDVVFNIDVPKQGLYKVALPAPTTYGQVTLEELNNLRSGNEGFVYGSKIKLTAIPAEGSYFTCWWDGSTENPREHTIQRDLSVKAEFSGSPSGIFPIEGSYQIYTKDRNILIETDKLSTILVTDIQGRTIYHANITGGTIIPVSNPGIYVVTMYGEDKLIKQQKVRVE